MPETSGAMPLRLLNILSTDDYENDRKHIQRSLKQCGLPSICS